MASATHHDRLDGWKAIAAHFGRDRTTVVRWARDRDLPVHRLPGGRTGTVYALRDELDRWARLPPAKGEPMPSAVSPPVPAAPPVLRRRRPYRLLALAAVALLGTGGAAVSTLSPSWSLLAGGRTPTLPADPAVAARFLAARDLVAERDADAIERGIGMLEAVARTTPYFASGHAALAEALVLSREFGRRDDAEAFSRARVAAARAVRLSPDLAAGHRLLGFIAYWADRDFAEADARFARALRLDPDDPLGHFWYGNVLSDHGDHPAALRELDRARLLMPGSVPVLADYGWARWAAGDEAGGLAILHDIARRHPDFAGAQDGLSAIALARGDIAGHARHYVRLARLRREPAMLARAGGYARAADPAALRALVLAGALADTADDQVVNAAPAMLLLAHANRLGPVRDRLRRAEARGDWLGDAAVLARLAAYFRDDAAIRRILARRGG